MIQRLLFSLFFFFWFFPKETKAQDCCGPQYCLSMVMNSGLGGGYVFQGYSAKGLNHQIGVFNSLRTSTLTKKMEHFGTGSDFAINREFFQYGIEENGVIVSVRFLINLIRDANTAGDGQNTRKYSLGLNTAGISHGFSKQIQEYAFLKVMDVYVTTTSEKFTNVAREPTVTPNIEELKSDENAIGVVVQSGGILYLGSPNLSFEGNDGYNLFSIDGFKFSDGRVLKVDERNSSAMSNAVNSGGFFISANFLASLPL